MSALKPCPFCGSGNVSIRGLDAGKPYSRYAICVDCFARGPYVTRTAYRGNSDAYMIEGMAADAWNKATDIISALRERVEAWRECFDSEPDTRKATTQEQRNAASFRWSLAYGKLKALGEYDKETRI